MADLRKINDPYIEQVNKALLKLGVCKLGQIERSRNL